MPHELLCKFSMILCQDLLQKIFTNSSSELSSSSSRVDLLKLFLQEIPRSRVFGKTLGDLFRNPHKNSCMSFQTFWSVLISVIFMSIKSSSKNFPINSTRDAILTTSIFFSRNFLINFVLELILVLSRIYLEILQMFCERLIQDLFKECPQIPPGSSPAISENNPWIFLGAISG